MVNFNTNILRANDSAVRSSFLKDLRVRRQSRYYLVSVNKGVAFARWSDQLVRRSDIQNIIQAVQKRKDLEIFGLEDVYHPQEPRNSKDFFSAVKRALETYQVVSLSARLVDPALRQKEAVPFELKGISLRSSDMSRQTTPGCFICGGNKGIYNSIIGSVRSEEEFLKLADMLGSKGISEASLRPETAASTGHRYPVLIGACGDHLSILRNIRDFSTVYPKNITKKIIELFIAYDKPDQEFGISLGWARKRAEEAVQAGFRFF